MGGGGKGGTSTSTVSIPPEVLARYNAVNARAEDVAQQPFQAYGGEFVAPLNEVQQQGISQTQQYSQAAQPYYTQAAGLTQQAVDATKPLTADQIQQYQNPYVQNVVDPTLAALRQQQGIDQAGQQAQAIRSGAFGGERAGLQKAVLQGQQELAQAQAISPLYASAYQNALAAAQQQQQQRTAGLMGAGQQIAGIGTGAQQAGLQGAQAAIGAGTLGQQTQQALDTAKYQQFLQQRGYDFQVAQFLANIAEGTGALSGSTTTTTQPTSFFSDKRLKENIKKIGKTNDGLPIYSFKYKGDDRTQIGLMAQDVEKKRPDAVGLAGGYKTVDYAKATAGSRTARAMGGLVPESMGGAVYEPGNFARGGFAGGGLITDPNDLQAILSAQKQSFGPFGSSGLYGGSAQQDPHGAVAGYVPKAGLAVPKLVTSSFQPKQQQGGLQSAMQDINAASTATSNLSKAYDWATGKNKAATDGSSGSGGSNPPLPPVRPASEVSGAKQGAFGTDTQPLDKDIDPSLFGQIPAAHGGGIMPRDHFAGGGLIDPYNEPTSGSMIPEDVMEDSESTKDKAEGQAVKPDGSHGSSGGGGGGLGSALGAASSLMTIGKGLGAAGSWLSSLPFFALKDGGSVPRQNFDDGGPAKQQGYAIAVPDELIPHFNAASEATGVPVPVLAAQAKQESRFRPDATGQAGEVGIGQILPSTARNPGYDMQGVDPAELRDPAKNIMFQAQYMKGIGDKLGVKDWSDPEQTAKALRAYNGGGDPNYVQNVFGHLYGSNAPKVSGAPQQAYPLQKQVEGGIGAAKGALDSIAPRTYQGEDRTMGQFLTSRDFVIPLLTGLGTMASSPSRYLGAAVLQGLGGAATSYANLQKQQADIDQSRALTSSTLSGIGPVVGEFKDGKIQYNTRPSMFGPSFKPKEGEAGAGTGVVPPVKPIEAAQSGIIKAPDVPMIVNTQGGRYAYDITPSDVSTQRLKNFGATGSASDKDVVPAYISARPEIAKAAAGEAKIANDRSNLAYQSSQVRRDVNTMAQAFNEIDNSASGFGPEFAARNKLFYYYNFLADKAGLPKYDAADKNLTSGFILDKLSKLQTGEFSQAGGSNAGFIQAAKSAAMPSGEMTPEAGRTVIAGMYLANQNQEDFRKFYNKYTAQYGTAYGVQDAFNQEFQPRLAREKDLIIHALTPQANGLSPADILRKNPAAAAEFDKKYGMPGLARTFIGG